MSGGPDWGDGDYALTARALMPAAETVVEAVGVAAGQDVLDVACGTGNASLAAAARGARVVGVDTAAALLEQAAARVPDAEFRHGDAGALPTDDAAFDVALSVFGVIFAPDPGRAIAEMLRSLRPGGRVALTTWIPTGPIAAAGGVVAGATLPRPEHPPRWGDPAWLTELLESHGARDVAIAEHALPFTAASPEGWFDEQAVNHPFWRWARRQLDDARWTRVREESVELLTAANEDPAAFATTSRYLLATGTRAAS